MKNSENKVNSMRGIVIGFIITLFVFTIGCTNTGTDEWGDGHKVVASDETIDKDSLEVLIKNLDD